MRRVTISLLLLLALLVASCGSGDSDGAEEEGSTSSSTQGGGDDGGGESAEPAAGGTLRIGLDAETDGWNPTNSQWSGASYAVASTIFDPLVLLDDDAVPHPNLAESVEPNDDYTVWTIVLRPGVRFHNGEALDAEAVALQLSKIKESALIGQLFGPLESTSVVDELTLDVQMNQPWVAFPALLATQGGFVAAPEQLNADPERAASVPIGTGAYAFDEWRRDDRFTATRNADYWRDGLPYPDALEFRVIPAPDTRVAALDSGQLDMVSTVDGATIRAKRDEGARMVEHEPDQAAFVMLNTAVPPLDDVRIRRALAFATDQQQLIDTIGRGLGSVADGPYKSDSIWYSPSGYPTEPDLAEATRLVEEYKADNGIDGDIDLLLGCTPVGTNPQSMDLLSAQWGKAGFSVELNFTEQATYINNAVFGDYQANCWTQFGTDDPDIDATWWLSANAAPPGAPALNFARIADAEIDAALQEGRTNPDREARVDAYGEVWKRFAEEVPYVWTTRGVIAILQGDRLRVDPDVTMPDGTAYPLSSVTALLPIQQLWLES